MNDYFGTSDYHFNKISETTGQLEEYVHSLLAARERLEAENEKLRKWNKALKKNMPKSTMRRLEIQLADD